MFPLVTAAASAAGQSASRLAEIPFKTAVMPDRMWGMATAEYEGTPSEVVHTENTVTLRHYEPAEKRHETPIVYAFALFNRPSIIDLSPDRSVVRQFLHAGFEVYVIEWGDPSRLDMSLEFSDYVDRYIHNCVDVVRDRTGADDVHLIGYSTSVPLAVMYAALHPEDVSTLTLKAPLVNFDTDGGLFDFTEFMDGQDPQDLVDMFGKVPSPLFNMGFAARKPVEYGVSTPLQIWDDLEDEQYVEEMGLRQKWFLDGPGMGGGLYRQFIKELVYENRLFENELSLNGRDVDLSNIDMPVLTVAGEDDKLVPESAYRPFLRKVSSDERMMMTFPTGHIGLSVEPQAHEEGWPMVTEWLADHS